MARQLRQPSLAFGASGPGNNNSGFGLDDLMGQLGGGGGLFGLGDVATGGLLSGGATLLSGLGSLLGGKSDAEKRSEKTFNLAENRLGQDVLHPEQYMSEYWRAAAPKFNMQADALSRRLGLDSGVAQGELANSMQSGFAQFLLNAKMQNDQLKSQRDNMLLQLMGSLGG